MINPCLIAVFLHFHISTLSYSSHYSSIIQFQHCQERFLRHFHITNLAHAFLAFFLFLQQFSFTADITTVTFGGNIFAHGADGFPGYYFCANTCLYSNLELLAWYQFFQFLTKLPSKFS